MVGPQIAVQIGEAVFGLKGLQALVLVDALNGLAGVQPESVNVCFFHCGFDGLSGLLVNGCLKR